MTFKLLIDGKLVDGAGALDVVNPATGKVFAQCAKADLAQLTEAIAAAKRAFPSWAATAQAERGAKLTALADAIDARIEEFAKLLVREQGKPFQQALGEVQISTATLRHFACQELPVEVLRETEKGKIIERRAPLGVVAAIMPWNFPMAMIATKIAPALTTGNTVVAKPAPTTPLTSLLLGELAAEIFPAGVINIIADENDLGAALSSHPDVAKISFTGSTGTGRKVMESAASSLKRLTLELGGNDACIVLDDVDVKALAPVIFQAGMYNAGQVCLAAKRVFVPRALYEEMSEELARLANEAVVDDGLNQGAQIGPVQNRMQYEKVLEIIEDARQRGTIVAGGTAVDREGFFIPPTIVRDLPDDALLVREEQFGPVMPLLAYDDIDEVVERANSTEYGLGGTIWTGDWKRGVEVASRINSGTVWINKWLELPLDIPFGGSKQSAVGRERGIEGLKEFTQPTVINIAYSV